MTNKTKILFIHHGTGIGGAPISLLNLINQLNPEKYECKVGLVKGGIVEELFRENGIKTEIIGANDNWFSHNETGKIQWKYFHRYPRIYLDWKRTATRDAVQYLEKQDADIIHLNSHVLTSWATAAHRLGFKVVLHNRETVARGYFGIRYRILKNLIEKNCDAIINISQDNQDRLGIVRNACVVYNFVRIPDTFRRSMADSESERKVLYLGGMAKIKGFATAVGCLPYLNENITIQFAGNLGTWKNPKTLSEKLKKILKLTVYRKTYFPLKKIYDADNAEVVGLLKDPLPAIDDCDILITPFKIEHFSRPAMEAFAYGKPVIGSDVEGMDEIIDHGVNGLLVEKENPKALAEAINYLSANPDMAREMGIKGRKKAEKVFSPEENTRKVEAIYDTLMKRV